MATDWEALAAAAAKRQTGDQTVTPGVGVTVAEGTAYHAYLGEKDDGFQSPFAGKDLGDAGRIPSNREPTERTPTVDEAAARIYGWSEKRLTSWEELLLQNGVIAPGEYTHADLVGAWQEAVLESGLFLSRGKKITPEQYIEMYASRTKGIGGAAGGPTTTTNTNTSVQNFDDLDARASANEAYSALLGRAATDDEAEAIQAALNAYSRAHPSISTSTTTTDGEGNTRTRTRSRGGVDNIGQMVEDKVKAAPGYAEFQAASFYMNALTSALGAVADVDTP